jgi:hypothetical protein
VHQGYHRVTHCRQCTAVRSGRGCHSPLWRTRLPLAGRCMRLGGRWLMMFAWSWMSGLRMRARSCPGCCVVSDVLDLVSEFRGSESLTRGRRGLPGRKLSISRPCLRSPAVILSRSICRAEEEGD